jgi:translation initiation factor 1A
MEQEENQEIIRVPLPIRQKDEMYAIVSRVLGGSRMNVQCADGKARMARIPGSKKRRISRIREGDLLIISPWEVQDEKADVLFRYKAFQARYLSKRNLLPAELDIF